jgi:drug/metabolite transporter (DMT)-like permease
MTPRRWRNQPLPLLARMRRAERIGRRPLSGANRKTNALTEFFRFAPGCVKTRRRFGSGASCIRRAPGPASGRLSREGVEALLNATPVWEHRGSTESSGPVENPNLTLSAELSLRATARQSLVQDQMTCVDNNRHNPRYRQLVAICGIVFATFVFGASLVGLRHGVIAGLTAADLVTLRYVVPGAIFLPLLIRSRQSGPDWVRGAAFAATAGAPYSFALLIGLCFAPATHAAVLNPGQAPLAVMLFNFLMFGERPKFIALFGGLGIIVGLALVAGVTSWSVDAQTWLGDVFLAMSGVSYGLFTVLIRRWRVSPVRATALVSVLSAIVWLPPYVALCGLGRLAEVPISEVVGQAVLQGGLSGGLATFLYARGVAQLGPSLAGLFPALVPVFGTAIATVVLGEHLLLIQWIGIALVASGILAAALRRHASATSAIVALDSEGSMVSYLSNSAR